MDIPAFTLWKQKKTYSSFRRGGTTTLKRFVIPSRSYAIWRAHGKLAGAKAKLKSMP
jgi:hypothetical protein